MLGRTLTSADERKGAENVVVLSSGLWRRRFGGSRDVVGRHLMVELHLPQATDAEGRRHAQFLDEVIAELEAVPAIVAATPVNVPPFSGQGWDLPRFTAEGQSNDETTSNPALNLESVHPNYFETLEVPSIRSAKRLKMGRAGAGGPWYTVVGVAAQTRYRDLASPRPTLALAGLGVAIGVAGALIGTQLLHDLLLEIDPLDPLAITASALLVIAVSAVASYLPARRATRIDAAEALRSP